MITDLAMQNLNTGLTITFIGMGVVLAFLTLMIGVMNFASWAIMKLNKYFPEAKPEEKTTKKKKVSNNDEEIALAVAIAHNMTMGGK